MTGTVSKARCHPLKAQSLAFSVLVARSVQDIREVKQE